VLQPLTTSAALQSNQRKADIRLQAGGNLYRQKICARPSQDFWRLLEISRQNFTDYLVIVYARLVM